MFLKVKSRLIIKTKRNLKVKESLVMIIGTNCTSNKIKNIYNEHFNYT